MPIRPITVNTCGQPSACVIQPINGANSTVAKYCDALKIAEAVPRSAVGNHDDTRRLLPGEAGASAAPARKGSVNNATTAAAAASPPTPPRIIGRMDHVRMLAAYGR